MTQRDDGELEMDVGSVRAQLVELSEKLKDLEALRDENADLRSRLAAGSGDQSKPGPITVHVRTPVPPPRLGVFTGLKPKGGGEVAFTDWVERVEQYLFEAQDPDEAFRRVRASLRGLAAEQAKTCKSAQDIVNSLKGIYGTTQTQEDLYRQFARLRMEKKEPPSEFFSRVWGSFADLNKDGTYTETEAARKVFHTFMIEAKIQHPMLCLELRNSFGFPGTASPDPSRVLRQIRELEEGQHGESSNLKATAAAHTLTTAPEIDYDKLATLVAQKLSASANQVPPQRTAPRGPCYKCGEVGKHYKRDCPNQANPQRVAQAKKQLNY
ncbi:hypothetical protein BaRGS_00008077 [Batillaria attramentaria]|uniref:CCHC-type domain-containing protein n=1 Tax=Batillaria attramentaria TaxID=370345 RepID=A0ABD0KUQ5_9CAEN